jgi:parallel beta-helix repeat protein
MNPFGRVTLAVLTAVMAAALGAPAGAVADDGPTLHVDQADANCSSGGPGSADQPFCTIGAAAAVAGPGTTVVVESGTYQETVRPAASGTADSPVTFTAAPGERVVVASRNAGDFAFYLWRLAHVRVRGFTVDGGNGIYVGESDHVDVVGNRLSAGEHGVYLQSTTDSRVEDNTVRRAREGIYLNASDRNRVAGNAISSGGFGVFLRYGADANAVEANVVHDNARGVYAVWSADNVIANNLIYANGDWGIRLAAADSDGTAPRPLGTGTRILSNTLSGNATASSVAAQEINVDGSTRTTIGNNVINVEAARAAIRIAPDSVPGTSLDGNVLDAPDGTRLVQWEDRSYYTLSSFNAATGQESQGAQGDPRFAAPADGDFSLTAGSPAVDSALSAGPGDPANPFALPANDAFGGGRVDDLTTPNSGGGTRPYGDRGAYEMRNPGFEGGLAGWNASGSGTGATITPVAAGHAGNGAVKLANSGTGPTTCALNDSPNVVRVTHAGTYSARAWVRADTPGATLKFRLREWNGTVAVGEGKTITPLTTDWQLVTVRYTAGAPGTSTLDLNAYVVGAAPGTCFYADDVSVALG